MSRRFHLPENRPGKAKPGHRINIHLSDGLADYLQSRLDTGLYESISDVMREALRLHQLTLEAAKRSHLTSCDREIKRVLLPDLDLEIVSQ